MSELDFLVKPHLITSLALDIAKLLAHGAPMPQDLDVAPLLENWNLGMTRRAPALTGIVSGHPKIEDGTLHSSELMIIDPSRRWARTLSRFYLLGAKAP
ncbi:hypothetical protein FF80_02514 [Devosia sp. LC5]|uniref:DUF6634 family protein n=1 Tax=Devosia sp. LC5 TaxID=1502724 RepID=UPI0004E36222|nr:DUF6634 family protein [Devosia sp. LC5]KFC66253.1 hypothetical protein FF80_02514 [Devosia sp. LC5]